MPGEDSRSKRPLSKRAQKKQAGKEEQREKKKERPQRKETERKQKREAFQQMSAEDQHTHIEKRRAEINEQTKEALLRKQRLRQVMESGQRIIIDLSFEDKLNNTEITRLCQQITSSYSVNARSLHPVHLHLAGFTGETADQLASQAGLEYMSRSEESYAETLVDQMENLVYLTSDANRVLECLEPKKTYIIGGIADKKGHKNVCLNMARRQNVETARLPIKEHLKLAGTWVLSIDQVVSVLVNWQETKDWTIAFKKAIPFKELPEAE